MLSFLPGIPQREKREWWIWTGEQFQWYCTAPLRKDGLCRLWMWVFNFLSNRERTGKGKEEECQILCPARRKKMLIAPSPTLQNTPPDESKLDERVPEEVCGENESRHPVYMIFLHCWGTLQTLCLCSAAPANPHCFRTLGHPTP